MKKTAAAKKTPPSFVAEFCEDFAGSDKDILLPVAADVIVLSRVASLRKLAKFFTVKLKREKPLSTTAVTNILDKYERGEIRIPQEELERRAREHPLAEHKFFASATAAEVTKAGTATKRGARVGRKKPVDNARSGSIPEKTRKEATPATEMETPTLPAEAVEEPPATPAKIELPATGPVPDEIWRQFAEQENLLVREDDLDFCAQEHAEHIGKAAVEALTDDDYFRLTGYFNSWRTDPNRNLTEVWRVHVKQTAGEVKRAMRRKVGLK